jgi:ABC-2 type transport system permease protein
MTAFVSGVGAILSLELRQRVRGTAWYVLLGVFVALLAVVTVLLTYAYTGFDNLLEGEAGGGIYSTIIYFVLLLGTLVAPALSGNAINGDREAGTLATTQVTLVTTGQIVVGKFLASWITALAFLAASIPFLIYSSFVGGLAPVTILVSLVILAIELGVVAAVGVGLSGILSRPLFSIVLTYLVVAALSVGTLIAFGLGGFATQSQQTNTTSYGESYSESGDPISCTDPETFTQTVPRFDKYWGVLVANPYVLLADAVPTAYNSQGYTDDLFGTIKYGVRSAQLEPELNYVFDECAVAETGVDPNEMPSQREVIDSTVPGWFVGLVAHLVLAIAALLGAWARTRTPMGRLSKGSRIA